jgi:hypothetical protein
MRALAAGLVALAGLAGCAAPEPRVDAAADPLVAVLQDAHERLAPVIDAPVEHQVQILYTRIDRTADGTPQLSDHAWRVDARRYFYPASTVKLPVAALALEELARLDVPGLDADTPMLTDAARSSQSAVHTHPRAPGGVPSVGHYVREILAVSDNDAFNRLYEFLGPAAIDERLAAKGLGDTRIVHRLESPLPPAEQACTNPVRFVTAGRTLHSVPARCDEVDRSAPAPIRLGVGEVVDGELRERPKDFATKNAYPLAELHATVRALVLPETVAGTARFRLRPADRRMLLRAMALPPRGSGIAAHAGEDDAAMKYLVGGGEGTLPEGVVSFNKVGRAYGFLTDAAYVVDLEQGVEFLLSATVHVNENGVFNDDEYEYETLGLPFLRELGLAVLAYERDRPREHRPDFAGLRALLDGAD